MNDKVYAFDADSASCRRSGWRTSRIHLRWRPATPERMPRDWDGARIVNG